MCFLWLTRLHSPNSKSIGSAIFAQLTAVSSGTLAPPAKYNWNCVQWCHLANTIEFVLRSPHPSPQPKRKIHQFSRFWTAHGRKSLYFTMGDPSPKNSPFYWGYLDPRQPHYSLGPSKPIIKTASRLVQPFLHTTTGCPYTLQWASLPPPLKIAPSHGYGGSGPHLIHLTPTHRAAGLARSGAVTN